mmetsp:Transcript_27610/g.58762  ORF Transcript_27610/g.58762 Transcript_27610/m.58762 type:complete len:378 (-) Transcript_27610:83-1216(-)
MAPVWRWGFRLSPLVLFYATAEEASCPENAAASGESSCSSSSSSSRSREEPLEFIALAEDLAALNRSTGNHLHEIQRVPCSGDWYYTDVPIILEGCCWALESAFRKGEEVPDCSNAQDFLPVDYFDVSHKFFLEHCGTEDLSFWNKEDDHYRNYIARLVHEPKKIQDPIDKGLRESFNISLSELATMVSKGHSMVRYFAEKDKFQAHSRPKHILGYFHPLSYHAMRGFWCSALKEQVSEMGFPMLSFFRQLPEFPWKNHEDRFESWASSSISFVVPKASFALPAHLHFEEQVTAVLLTEGKKHWQFIAATEESFRDLQPVEGLKRLEQAFYKLPIDVAHMHPVYVGTQSKGDVLLPPRNWVHLAYSFEDSVSLLFMN